MYGFHCIPPFSKSFIYVNTRVIKIHGFNSNESASFSSLQALLTTQLLSHIWKEQKDFRGKILSPWPLEDFAIGVHDSIISKILLLQLIIWKLTIFSS